jgi:hypothetical protein
VKPPSHQGWMVSLRGDVNVRIECMLGSTLPVDLRKLGYTVIQAGDSERILPHQFSGLSAMPTASLNR